MSKIRTFSKMDFDKNIETEVRFAMRRWLEKFISEVNFGKQKNYKIMFSDEFEAIGFRETILNRDEFAEFLNANSDTNETVTMRLPELQIKKDKNSFVIYGTFEQFFDSILFYEGTIKIKVRLVEGEFYFEKFNFYPRLKVSFENE